MNSRKAEFIFYKTFLLAAVFWSVVPIESSAQAIFEDWKRDLYGGFLEDAIKALDAKNLDMAAFESVKTAMDNMKYEVDEFSSDLAKTASVMPGYEPRLNSFAGKLAGFNLLPDAERSDREGRQAGAANTVINYVPEGSSPKSAFAILIIVYGVPEFLRNQILSGQAQNKASVVKTFNGLDFRSSESGDRSEKSYAGVFEDRLLVIAIASDFNLAEQVLSKLDTEGLLAFRQ